jgi:hypothetical protein
MYCNSMVSLLSSVKYISLTRGGVVGAAASTKMTKYRMEQCGTVATVSLQSLMVEQWFPLRSSSAPEFNTMKSNDECHI